MRLGSISGLVVCGLLAGGCGMGSGAGHHLAEAGSLASGEREPHAAGQSSWEEIHTGRDSSPSASEDSAGAYDAARQRVLLYGGKDDDDVVRNELWSFDLPTRSWTRIDSPGPPPREDHTLILDEANDSLVLFGGEDGSTSSETWAFDLGSERWTEITDDTAPALEDHVAIYDPRGRRMIVFGGMRGEKAHKDEKLFDDETWALDLDRDSPRYRTWSVLATSQPRPSPRREHRGLYDPVRHRLLVFGGRRRTKTNFLNDAWALDLESLIWREIGTTGERPEPVRQAAVGYDPATDQLIVFGGEVHVEDADDEFTVNEVWVLNVESGIWSNRTFHPRPLYDHLGVFVPELGGTLIYGGTSSWPRKEHGTWLLRVR